MLATTFVEYAVWAVAAAICLLGALGVFYASANYLGLVDRVAVMHHGSLLALDSPEAVMADPTVQSAYLGEPV